MKIINLYGGPGTGKSTTAAGLFNIMKLEGYECELVTEYAKSLVWSGRLDMFNEPGYVFAKQAHMIKRLQGKVDFAITDSPLLLPAVYSADKGYLPSFEPYVLETFETFDNVNIMLRRVKKYNPNGRNETEDEAKQKDSEIEGFLEFHEIDYEEVVADVNAPQEILKQIKEVE